ncbi:hypothetical protein [Pantoea cypripedii]|nr:hypothetical protein [Pantoea cypripedii]MBP2198575.1 hypothetical protein [Pantoea cypripedii]
MSAQNQAFTNQIDKTKRLFISAQQCHDVFRQNEVGTTPGEEIRD